MDRVQVVELGRTDISIGYICESGQRRWIKEWTTGGMMESRTRSMGSRIEWYLRGHGSWLTDTWPNAEGEGLLREVKRMDAQQCVQ